MHLPHMPHLIWHLLEQYSPSQTRTIQVCHKLEDGLTTHPQRRGLAGPVLARRITDEAVHVPGQFPSRLVQPATSATDRAVARVGGLRSPLPSTVTPAALDFFIIGCHANYLRFHEPLAAFETISNEA